MTDMTDLEWLARNVSEFPPGAEYVMKTSGDKVLAWSWDDYCGQFPVFSKDQWQAERQRLGLDAPEWDGELPPVGCECEVDTAHLMVEGDVDAMWNHCEILAHRDGCAIGWVSVGGVVCVSNPAFFRPLKSQEQRERDEAVEAALKLDMYPMGQSAGGMMSRKEFCQALYDAGMLKKPD